MLTTAVAMITPRTTQGVLELLPGKQLAFQRMLDTIRRGFERFGFLPVETPVFELSSVLLTKTGGETEKQVYFVQSTGAIAQSRSGSGSESGSGSASGSEQAKLPDLALRFDLTVPLARYVAEHEHDLNFPFRRYQIQRVYRGERNQKGRFREFYQCDIDVIGKDALPIAHDAELPAIIHGIFAELGIGAFAIYINNRKVLRGLLEMHGCPADSHDRVLHAVDRLRKVGSQVVAKEIEAIVPNGRTPELIKALLSPDDELDALAARSDASPTLAEGIVELRAVRSGAIALGVPEDAIRIDRSIVRGLDYYTGTVYETFLLDHQDIGSICSGGRYDNLAGHYTKSKLPGVGISIGVTRLFWQLDQLGKLPHAAGATAHVLIIHSAHAAALATRLRAEGLNVEVYASDDKLGKQLKYADRARVPFVVFADAGPTYKLKDLRVADERAPEVQLGFTELVDLVTKAVRAPRA
jgi:histidyl-tRNA synthetase